MALSIKNHPFAVDALFDRSTVLTYAIPKQALQDLIPPSLTLDTFLDNSQNEWAFLAVALVQTRQLRPAGFPKWLGSDFFLIGYRIFVTYTTQSGKRLRGLYILKSETDKQKMVWLGNLFSHYQYSKTDILARSDEAHQYFTSHQSGLNIAYLTSSSDVPLPVGSPFPNWKVARRYAGPLPFTFTQKANTRDVLIIEGVRENWTPKPIEVTCHQVDFLMQIGLKAPRLASAFTVQNIPYSWKKGRLDRWMA